MTPLPRAASARPHRRRPLGPLALVLAVLAAGPGVPRPVAAQPGARLHVTLEANAVTLRGADPEPDLLEVVRAGGVVAVGFPRASRPGEVDYAIGGWRTEPARVVAGDVVRLAGAVPAVAATAPDLRADIDAAAGRIVGIGPAGAELQVRATYHDVGGAVRAFDAPVLADPGDGRFAVDLPGAGAVPGDRGDVAWVDAGGHAFHAPFAVFQGRITLGEARVAFDAAPGLAGHVVHTRAGGAAGQARPLRAGGSANTARPGETVAPLDAPAAAGDLVAVTLDHPLVGRGRTHTAQVPTLALQLVPQNDTAIGRAPPGAAVTVTVRGPGGAEHTRRTVAAADGGVAVDFVGVADLDRGWRGALTVEVGDGWAVTTEALVGLVHVEADVGVVWGDVHPGAAVTVSAHDARGAEVQRWDTTANDSGRFGVDLVVQGGRIQAEVLDLTPGMAIGIDLDHARDPQLIEIPVVAAQPDIDRESVAGAAPPGYRIVAEAMEGTRVVARTAEVVVGVDGRFEASLAGTYDVEPGAYGRLTASRPDGHQLSLTWAAVDTRLDLDAGVLWVNAATNRTGTARLRSRDGVERAAAALATRRQTTGSRRVTAVEPFRDRFGRAIVPAPGDTVDGMIGDARFTFGVPRLEAAVHVGDDRVAGSTDAPAGTAVRLDATDAANGARAVRAGVVATGGAFAFDLAQPPAGEPAFDLRHNAQVTLRLDRRAERFSRRVAVPGLVLDLGGARLTGALAPDATATVTWRRAGQPLVGVAIRADAAGGFAVDLRHPDGRRFDLQPADTIAVDGPGLTPAGGIAMAVPTLELAFDRAANALHGRIGRRPGDRFRLETKRLQPLPGTLAGGRWDDKLTWLDGGRFAIDFDAHPVVQPLTGETQAFAAVTGAVATGTLDDPDGQRAVLTRVLPMLHLQHDGGAACGQADPDAAVDLRLVDPAGRTVAHARTQAAPDGRFQVRWADAGGDARLREGLRLEGDLGGDAVSLEVPPMRVAVDWSAFSLVLHGLPRHTYRVRYPALWDCWGEATDALRALDAVYVATGDHETNADGMLQEDLGPLFEQGAAPAQGIEVETLAPGLHRLYTFAFPLQVEVHLGTAAVAGRASPGHAITGQMARGGAPRARGAAAADSDGGFMLRLVPEGAAPPAIAAGDVLTVATAGDAVRLEVPPLDFDFSADTGVVGAAAPNAAVALTFRLADGRALTTAAPGDARGRFAFTPADLPPREAWTLADVRSVRAAYGFARHHRVVRDTRDGAAPAPPPDGGRAVYLPCAVWGRVSR